MQHIQHLPNQFGPAARSRVIGAGAGARLGAHHARAGKRATYYRADLARRNKGQSLVSALSKAVGAGLVLSEPELVVLARTLDKAHEASTKLDIEDAAEAAKPGAQNVGGARAQSVPTPAAEPKRKGGGGGQPSTMAKIAAGDPATEDLLEIPGFLKREE